MPVDFSGKWMVDTYDDVAIPYMKTQGFADEMVDYMLNLSFEVIHKGNVLTFRYITPEGKTEDSSYSIGGPHKKEKDAMDRECQVDTNWEGDKVVSVVTSSDPSFPKQKSIREMKGDKMMETNTMVESGLTSVTFMKKVK